MSKKVQKFTRLIAYFVLLLLFFLLIFVFYSLSQEEKPNVLVNSDLFEQSQDLKVFTSSSEITGFIKENSYVEDISILREIEGLSFQNDVVSSAPNPISDTNLNNLEYSNTNNQENNVDEADIVKTDGNHIYVLSQDKISIIDSLPASNINVLSQIEVEGNPVNLFINRDRLVVFTTNYEDVYAISEFDYIPTPRSEAQTIAYVYDISDRTEPVLIKDYSITGNYFESRMIGDYVYFISKESIYYYGGSVHVPGVRQNGVLLNKQEVFYFDNPEDNYEFNTIGSFNIFEDREKFEAKTFLLGNSNNLYISENNIYISYRKAYQNDFYQYLKVDMFFRIIVPILPTDVQKNILKVEKDLEYDSMDSYIEAWDKISLLLENMYNYMDEDEQKELISEIEQAVSDYESKIEDEQSLTIIHKIGIIRDNIEYLSRGEVKGYLLNQFSLSEDENSNLRIATTTDFYSREIGSTSYSNVYILDPNLELIGKIEKIAPSERIYSTRFMGDKLYMVTFDQVDPLFTIDLSDSKNPEIKGQLKIPGFSSYLHPYDEDHIIGIGLETYLDDNQNVLTKGVKLSLFDVLDFENPIEVDTVIIGDSGSYSQVLNDHKAFLFDKDRNLLVLPVYEVSGKYETDLEGYFRENTWNGAYVYTITSNGFKERGKISHIENDKNINYWSSPYNVKRALYIEDNLYTISDKLIKVNDLGTVDMIGQTKLTYEDGWYPFKDRWEVAETFD
jgi:uncharacterized secreted protein with C-terminal beta-propeller domain